MIHISRTAALALSFCLAASSALAQQPERARVDVRDDRGEPVPFALVTLVGGVSAIADDSGSAMLTARTTDSLRLQVRRIGYQPHFGWVRRSAGGSFPVSLKRVATNLAAVEITEREQTPLGRTGFYDRVQRVQRGAIVGEFLTPEELDFRNASTVTRILSGSRYAKIDGIASGRVGPRVQVALGRGGCKMTILVDGQVVHGTAQELQSEGGDPRISIDDVIDGRSIAGIEIYPSTANAPAELVRPSGRGSCGIVAIWTGARR